MTIIMTQASTSCFFQASFAGSLILNFTSLPAHVLNTVLTQGIRYIISSLIYVGTKTLALQNVYLTFAYKQSKTKKS